MTMTGSQLDLFDDGDGETRAIDYHVPTFDEWWQNYPRKKGKAVARGHWSKMSPPERVSAWNALAAWQRYVTATGTAKFVPYASTWLKQQRWEDDPPVVEADERKAAPGMTALRSRMARIYAEDES